MNRRFLRLLISGLALCDLVCCNIVFAVAAAVMTSKPMPAGYYPEYVCFLLIINSVWPAVAFYCGVYRDRNALSFELFTRASLRSYVYFVLLAEALIFFFRLTALSRLFIAIVLGGIFLLLMAGRLLYLVIGHYLRHRDWATDRVLIIGYNPLARRLVGHLTEQGVNKKIVGFCDDRKSVTELSEYPILGEIEGAADICKVYGVNEIYSTIAPEHNDAVYELIHLSEKCCIRFRIVPDMTLFIKKPMVIDHYNEMPILCLRKEPLEDLGNRVKKRVFDLVVSVLSLLLVLSWVMPLIGLLILLESAGPVFFLQRRTGRNNRSFSCIKFRSMYPNDNANSQQASRNDGRVTRLGRILRRTSLDELPQFINVIKGDMSIVGPRPHMLKHTDQYAESIERYMVRQFIKPGITGWAQIGGFRGETRTLEQMEKRVEHDLWYLEHWNLFLDVKIIVLTAWMIIKGDKNAF